MPEPLIVAHHLVKKFGDFTAVDGIDIEVQPGEVFGFLNPNGAGKGSTMRMIANAGVRTASVVGHVAVLVALSVVALVIAARRIDSLLRK